MEIKTAKAIRLLVRLVVLMVFFNFLRFFNVYFVCGNILTLLEVMDFMFLQTMDHSMWEHISNKRKFFFKNIHNYDIINVAINCNLSG